MVNKVYPQGKLYYDVESLKTAVFHAWDEIEQDYLQKLCHAMRNHMQKIIDMRGKPIGY